MFNETYRVYLPILSSNNVVETADTILVVESARLDMTGNHHVKGRVRRLVRIIYVYVIATNSQGTRFSRTLLNHSFLPYFAA